MVTFLKANAASLIASSVDYFITIALEKFFRIDVVLASMTGTICGGVTNFLIGKHWAFNAGSGSTYKQALRYVLVWCGNLVLNTGGFYAGIKLVGKHYYVAVKLFISLLVAFGYNYPLQKKFVFKA
ncbi:GtrA family protein [Foetidibacter luteolus]|uniref:GtrA family protein n=1 Tax=Foetidibacter luteolus TaxID=2608880 RepID=UPI00129BF36B|nr:GtrA family protein [Foetidibacter luteolus]